MDAEQPIATLPFYSHRYFTLFCCWLFLTCVNLNKAYHIDDTFHLEAAEWIGDHPLNPMSGMVNWDAVPQPLHEFNQPPLFFYLIAGFTKLFGTNEIPLHLFLSIFTFLALFFFQKICDQLLIKKSGWLVFFLAFSPAFIVNQNLMTDVPILSLELVFIYYLLKAGECAPLKNYLISSVILGCGLLIKYSLLPLILVLLFVLLIRKHFKFLICLLIPITFLALWSVWNYIEYAGVHLLGRPRDSLPLAHFMDFMNCLGAISAFSIIFIYSFYPSKILKWLILIAALAFLLSVVGVYLNYFSSESYNKYLSYSFTLNGFIICAALIVNLLKRLNQNGWPKCVTSPDFVLLLSVAGLAGFTVLLAPFVATRHVLLVIPLLLLLGNNLINETISSIKNIGVLLTVVLGILLGVSDWVYADTYRQLAAEINLPKGKTMWTAGHWGWQWYSKKRGMKQYNDSLSILKPGDYLAFPDRVSHPYINTANMKLIEKKILPPTLLSFVSVEVSRMYASETNYTPWVLSKEPIDAVYIFEMDSIATH